MAEIRFRGERLQAFFDKIRRNKKKITNADRAWADIVGIFVFKDVLEHFEKEAGPDGKWQGWSPLYAKHMANMGKAGNKLLQDTGRLRQSFLPTSYRKAAGGIEWFNPAKTKGGFPYAKAHDEGGPQLPQRQFMWLSNKAMQRISKASAAFMLRGKG